MSSENFLRTWTDLTEALALHTPLTLVDAIALTTAIEFGSPTRGTEGTCSVSPGVLFGPLTVLLGSGKDPQEKGHAVRAIIDLAQLWALTPEGSGEPGPDAP